MSLLASCWEGFPLTGCTQATQSFPGVGSWSLKCAEGESLFDGCLVDTSAGPLCHHCEVLERELLGKLI